MRRRGAALQLQMALALTLTLVLALVRNIIFFSKVRVLVLNQPINVIYRTFISPYKTPKNIEKLIKTYRSY